MKKISFKYLGFVLLLAVSLVACNDFEDENYDFSNTALPYVELSAGSYGSDTLTDLTVNFRRRVATQQAVAIDYELSGDLSGTGTVTIEAGVVSAPLIIPIPGSPDTLGTANITITSVSEGFTIGRAAGGNNIEASIAWQPGGF